MDKMESEERIWNLCLGGGVVEIESDIRCQFFFFFFFFLWLTFCYTFFLKFYQVNGFLLKENKAQNVFFFFSSFFRNMILVHNFLL